MPIDHDPYCDDGGCTTCFPQSAAQENDPTFWGQPPVIPDIPPLVVHDSATCAHCQVKTIYQLQYQRTLSAHWIDSGQPETVYENAVSALAFVRGPEQQAMFKAEWRLVVRTTTESVLDPAPPTPHGYEVPTVTPISGMHGGGTALTVKPYNGYVEVGWSRYTIEQSDELIAAIQRAQLRAAEQR